MKKLIQSLMFVMFLSLAGMPAARGDANNFLSDLTDIYWFNNKAFRTAVAEKEKPMIAVVIDDMGVNIKGSARATEHLSPAVTLSFLAYARHIREQVKAAQEKGHEIMLHLPWEADNKKADPGPHHLSVDMTSELLQKNLIANLEGFEGYVGLNNHMGSKFSRYRPGLEIVMAELSKRGVFFLDSKTTSTSIAESVARDYGLSTTHSDVFLDHEENPKMVGSSLHEVEAIARRRGSVVAIGHPKKVTLDALEAWIPTLEAKGFQLVPLSRVVTYRQEIRENNIEAHLAPKKLP